ncbi:PadR family transcriptional regulator [uncultured Methanobrevibacter sp.]|uniref:PadR family transcriptional regulator n=1 Tax=uncultured Methanobrevibacter sp. TaxID=253161 RepID=UPI0025E97517|nr:PadR family transcriptional regulator [uncultured Methanobrevibacter sp.]
MSSIKNNEYSEFIKNDKIVTHTVNGISRFLMLWIIQHYGPIHGYNISKEFSEIFEVLISSGNLKKSNPSKMYPILKDMEGNGLIAGDDVLRDNKKVKFYKITEKGEFLLNHVCNNFNDIRKSPKGSLFFDDFLNF